MGAASPVNSASSTSITRTGVVDCRCASACFITGELWVDDHRRGLAMVQHEGNGFGIQPGVEGVEHRASHRHTKMRLHHRRRVGHHGHGVVFADTGAAARRARHRAPRSRPKSGFAACRARRPGGPVDRRVPDETQRRHRRVIVDIAGRSWS